MHEPDAMGDDGAPAPPDDFERALVDALARASAHADALLAQAVSARVVRRDRTPDGRTTYLCVAADTPRLADGELTTRARVELHDGPSGSAELSVHNGWLDSITVLLDGPPWPADPRLGRVRADG